MDIRINKIEENDQKQNILDEILHEDNTIYYECTYTCVEDITIFLAAFCDDKCIGIIDGIDKEFSGRIDMFILLSEYKDNEVGKLLLDEIEKYFIQKGHKSIFVNIPDCNFEIYEKEFYRNNGYTEIERIEKDWEYFYAIKMVKIIKN